MAVEYREFRDQDFSQIVDVMRNTWELSPEMRESALLESEYSLLGILANMTFSQIAFVDGRPVGILIGTSRDQIQQGEKKKQYLALRDQKKAEIKKHRLDGTAFCHMYFAFYDKIHDKMLRKTGTSYPSELALFVLLQEQRGKGIGRHLFESFAEDLQKKQVSRFYVRTDGMCNYGFYEHMGMKRIAKSFLGLPFLKSCELYQYGKELD